MIIIISKDYNVRRINIVKILIFSTLMFIVMLFFKRHISTFLNIFISITIPTVLDFYSRKNFLFNKKNIREIINLVYNGDKKIKYFVDYFKLHLDKENYIRLNIGKMKIIYDLELLFNFIAPTLYQTYPYIDISPLDVLKEIEKTKGRKKSMFFDFGMDMNSISIIYSNNIIYLRETYCLSRTENFQFPELKFLPQNLVTICQYATKNIREISENLTSDYVAITLKAKSFYSYQERRISNFIKILDEYLSLYFKISDKIEYNNLKSLIAFNVLTLVLNESFNWGKNITSESDNNKIKKILSKFNINSLENLKEILISDLSLNKIIYALYLDNSEMNPEKQITNYFDDFDIIPNRIYHDLINISIINKSNSDFLKGIKSGNLEGYIEKFKVSKRNYKYNAPSSYLNNNKFLVIESLYKYVQNQIGEKEIIELKNALKNEKHLITQNDFKLLLSLISENDVNSLIGVISGKVLPIETLLNLRFPIFINFEYLKDYIFTPATFYINNGRESAKYQGL